MIELSMQQWTVLTFIQAHQRKHGKAPDFRQIGKGCWLLPNKAMYTVRELVCLGVLNASLCVNNVSVAVQP